MGNVVVGEALVQLQDGGGPRRFHSYAAMQAAVAAKTYSPAANARALITLGVDCDSGTPDLYANYFQDGQPSGYLSRLSLTQPALNGATFHNYFNARDNALSGWQVNQNLKPTYWWGGYFSKPPHWEFAKGLPFVSAIEYSVFLRSQPNLLLPQLVLLDRRRDRFEIMSMISEARSFALGAEPNMDSNGPLQWNSHDLNFEYGWGASPSQHSAQFNSVFRMSGLFWYNLLKTMNLSRAIDALN